MFSSVYKTIFAVSLFLAALQPLVAVEENQELPTAGQTHFSKPTNFQPLLLPPNAKSTAGVFVSSNMGGAFYVSRQGASLNRIMPTAEMKFGYNFNAYLGAAFSYQFQSEGRQTITLPRTSWVHNKLSHEILTSTFKSYNQVFAIKFVVSPPSQLLWKIFNFKPYAAIGMGESLWWSRVNANRKPSFRVKTLYQPVAVSELGLTIGSGIITSTVGCKFNAYIFDMRDFSGQAIPYFGLQMHF